MNTLSLSTSSFINGNTNMELTVLVNKDQLLFLAKDVADSLDYVQTSDMLRRLKSKQVVKLQDIREPALNALINENSNLAPNSKFITEAGLYRAILRSEKPEAEQFQDWIVEEVLPSIRKTGSYSFVKQEKLEATPENLQLVVSEEQLQELEMLRQQEERRQAAKQNAWYSTVELVPSVHNEEIMVWKNFSRQTKSDGMNKVLAQGMASIASCKSFIEAWEKLHLTVDCLPKTIFTKEDKAVEFKEFMKAVKHC